MEIEVGEIVAVLGIVVMVHVNTTSKMHWDIILSAGTNIMRLLLALFLGSSTNAHLCTASVVNTRLGTRTSCHC